MPERFENTHAVLDALQQDISAHREQHGLFKTTIAGAASSLILPYQLGGLESTLTYVGTQTLGATHSPFMAGGAVGLASFAIESGLTLASVASLRRLPQTAQTFEALNYEAAAPEQKNGRFARLRNTLRAVGFTATMGAPGMTLRSFVRAPEKPVEQHRAQGIKAAAALAITNTFIGLTLTGGLDVISPSATETVIHEAQKPLTYGILIGLIGGRRLASYLHSELRAS